MTKTLRQGSEIILIKIGMSPGIDYLFSPMPLNFLGKVLFPRQQAWYQRRQAKIIILVLLVAIGFAAFVAAIMLARNARH
jgi:hypothetical protein